MNDILDLYFCGMLSQRDLKEKQVIAEFLNTHQDLGMVECAVRMSIGRSTLYSRMKEYGISRSRIRGGKCIRAFVGTFRKRYFRRLPGYHYEAFVPPFGVPTVE